jgi:hypothetical protein
MTIGAMAMPLCALPASLLAVLLLAGCDINRPGTWQASGVNDANLRAMLAEPAHAVRGVSARTERGQPASLAIRRLEQGRRQPLPDSRASQIGATGASAAPDPEPANGR